MNGLRKRKEQVSSHRLLFSLIYARTHVKLRDSGIE